MAVDVEFLFGPDGPLARSLSGFKSRAVQAEMAEIVGQALEQHDLRLIEAGTGTGKTFAYLVPALTTGKRVIVSTGTKNLQDQLFERDLPRLLEALAIPARIAMLKGRSNYLCIHRMKRAGQDNASARRPVDFRLEQVERWSHSTDRGEVSELGRLVEDDRLRFQITSTADNCLGSKCDDFAECFVVKNRRAAMGADLVVANHHVLLSDVVLKEEGFGEILPGADAVIVDEAHQLPELAGQFFGTRVSTRQLRDLADEALKLAGEYPDLPEFRECAAAMAGPIIQLESKLSALNGRCLIHQFLDGLSGRECVDTVLEVARALAENLDAAAERGADLESVAKRARQLIDKMDLCVRQDEEPFVRWVEAAGRGGALHATPLTLGEGFSRVFKGHPGAWIMTSATLSAAGDFSHFRGQLGMDDIPASALESPFDYAGQSRLFMPEDFPEPSARDYPERVARLALDLIQAGGGGMFILCTSYRALNIVAEQLRGKTDCPLFVQGDEDRSRLVEAFASAGNGVLVGTHSFWEGVDVKGRALRVVMIDKLPFASPGDPVYDARLEDLRRRGGNPFMEIQLPEAIVSLRQGVGRLIRDETDQGLLVLCDPRLQTKRYGKKMMAALPAMPRVSLEEARQYLRSL